MSEQTPGEANETQQPKKPDPVEQARMFKTFIEGKRILIADSHPGARETVSVLLKAMGAQESNIVMASTFEGAETAISTVKTPIVISDFTLGIKSGLDLAQKQRRFFPNVAESFFFIVTSDTSQAAVARAVEEDVDAYLIKPFTTGTFKATFVRAVLRKVYPTDYQKTVELGKKQLAEGKVDEAIETLKRATELDSNPTLALYYSGQAQEQKKEHESAEQFYQRGLRLNRIHYKCLTGLHETLVQRNKHAEAYDVMKRISTYYPASPQHLTSILRLAVITQSYDDIEKYYRVFTSIDEKNEEMIKYLSAALVICGKHYLHQAGASSRAVELFRKATATSSGRTKILREIIAALAEVKMSKQAEEFLDSFPSEAKGTPEHQVLAFVATAGRLRAEKVIRDGQELMKKGVQDPLIHKVMIERAKEADLKEEATRLTEEACSLWPDQKDEFK